MRLLFAKAIDAVRTAMIIETGFGLMGGVALMINLEHRVDYRAAVDLFGAPAWINPTDQAKTELTFFWEWYRYFDSVDDFVDTRGWERPPDQIEQQKLLEHR